MKTRLLIVLYLFSGLLLQAKIPKTLSDLKTGDWFTLEYSQFLPVQDDTPPLRNADVIEYRVSVLEKARGALRISVRPTRFYRSTIGEVIRKSNDKKGFNHWLHDAVGEKSFINYFDSNYASDFNPKKDYYFGENDSVVFRLDLKNSSLSDTVYYLKQNELYFSLDMVVHGIRRWSGLHGKTVPNPPAKIFLNTIVLNYFAVYDPHQLLKDKEGYLEEDNSTYCIKLIGASFPLSPNVKLSYYTPTKLTENQLSLEVEGKRYKLKQNSDGLVCFELYLSSPAVCKMVNGDLLLTPGDSLSISDDGSGNLTFTGKGSGNCKYYFELNRNLDLFARKYNQSIDNFEKDLEKGWKFYQSLWDKYASEMTPYWLCSSQLSFKYWYIDQYLTSFQITGLVIPWYDSIFTSVIPLIDYKYQPLFYNSFLNSYGYYKFYQLAGEDVLMGSSSFQIDMTGKYYFYKNFFLGYPKYYQLSEHLKSSMANNSSYYYQREYDDFISSCKDITLLHKMKDEYEDAMKSEPGKNIKNLPLNFLDQIPLKSKADGYILIVMGSAINPRISTEQTVRIIEDSLSGFPGKIQVMQPSIKGDYEFRTNDSLVYYGNGSREVSAILRSASTDLLLIRNDGTIVAKNIRNYWNNAYENGDLKWDFKIESVTKLLLEDMEKMKKSRFDASLWGIIGGAVAVFILLVFLLYKMRVRSFKKKEESKRLVSELELKAIRSQMNPHFIFNALSSIQHLINRGDNEKANQYLLNFSKLLRMVLTSSEKKLIPLSEEIEQIDLYLRLEQLRVPFEYEITVNEGIYPDDESVPGMLIQPIVENAFIHGIVPNQGGRIQIRFNKENKTLFVDILDDGPGFIPAHHHSKRFGLKATEERLRLINNELKTNIGVHIEKNDPTGTRVIISVPV